MYCHIAAFLQPQWRLVLGVLLWVDILICKAICCCKWENLYNRLQRCICITHQVCNVHLSDLLCWWLSQPSCVPEWIILAYWTNVGRLGSMFKVILVITVGLCNPLSLTDVLGSVVIWAPSHEVTLQLLTQFRFNFLIILRP